MLQWGDVDFANRFIEVQRNLVSGKLTTPKNSRRRRVDMSAHLAETLEHYGHLVPGSNRAAVDRLDDTSTRIPGASSGTTTKRKRRAN